MQKKMLSTAYFTFFVIFCTFGNICSKQLPSNFKTCRISDKDFEECLKINVADAFTKLASGNKEFGIPPLDPFYFKEVEIEPVPGPISLYQKYTEVYLTGVSTVKVSDFKIDFKKCSMYIGGIAPSFKAETDYIFKGQLMVFPINAKGHFISLQKNYGITGNVTCEIYKEDNLEYIRLIDAKILMSPQEASFQIGDIIPGNKQLNDEVHKLINDDPLTFFEIIRPTANMLFSAVFIDLGNKVFSKVPMRDIFKD